LIGRDSLEGGAGALLQIYTKCLPNPCQPFLQVMTGLLKVFLHQAFIRLGHQFVLRMENVQRIAERVSLVNWQGKFSKGGKNKWKTT
jgi:hypothetical protein